MVPFLVGVVAAIKQKRPDFVAVLKLSSFVSDDDFNRICSDNDLSQFVVIRDERPSFLAYARLLVTIPGSNTAEAGYLRVPMLMLLPLNDPKALIFDGLLGLLSGLPGIGSWLKQVAIRRVLAREKPFSLPNLMSGREIVPELIGVLDLVGVADDIICLYEDDDRLLEISDGLRTLEGGSEVVWLILNEFF